MNKLPALKFVSLSEHRSQSPLTRLPYEVLLYHLIPNLPNTATVFRLFSTCTLFHEMIGHPTPSNHRKWKLSPSLIAKLRLGTPDNWIHGISYYFTGLFSTLKCQDKNCLDLYHSRGSWRWEFRAVFCNSCLANNTIRYVPRYLIIIVRNISTIAHWISVPFRWHLFPTHLALSHPKITQ
jgi:hypothetical protein